MTVKYGDVHDVCPVACMWYKQNGYTTPTLTFESWPPFEPLEQFDPLYSKEQMVAYAKHKVEQAIKEFNKNIGESKEQAK